LLALGQIIGSLINPGFETATFQSIAQRATHCTTLGLTTDRQKARQPASQTDRQTGRQTGRLPKYLRITQKLAIYTSNQSVTSYHGAREKKKLNNRRRYTRSLLYHSTRVNVHNLAQVTNWRSLVKRLWSCNRVPCFKLIDLTKGNKPRGFWSSIILKRGHDCSSEDVFTRLRQFVTCAKLCTFTLHV
jgi:hypothetical protein